MNFMLMHSESSTRGFEFPLEFQYFHWKFQLLPNMRCKMMQKVRPGNEKRKYLLITESLRTELQEIFVFGQENVCIHDVPSRYHI